MVFVHVLPPSVERSTDADETIRHRISGFDGETDSVAIDSLLKAVRAVVREAFQALLWLRRQEAMVPNARRFVAQQAPSAAGGASAAESAAAPSAWGAARSRLSSSRI